MLVALPVAALLMFAVPVPSWRTGERNVAPLTLVSGGPAVELPRRIWIDTDAGCGHAPDADADDCFALLILLRAPGIEIVGISTVAGNAPPDAVLRITRELVQRAGRAAGPPVHAGSTAAGGTPAHAALRDALAAGPLTVVALGPLTNVAAALRGRPELQRNVGRLVAVMGRRPRHLFHPAEGRGNGILWGHGPVFRDFNFEKDRSAAAEVLALGIPITLVPYEGARHVSITGNDLAALRAAGGAPAWVAERAGGWLEFWRDVVGLGGFYPFDAVAAAYALEPALFDCAAIAAWVARDRGLRARFFGSEALLVGVERERTKEPRASGTVIYCPRVAAGMHDWMMRRLAAR
jgi:inosine-uridine nucleoside N-ribohydrolase